MAAAASMFPAQGGEQDHVADAGAVGQQHHKPVDADAAATGGRHAVFEGADEIVVEIHGLVVSAVLGFHLGLEAGGLVFRVVELGEAVAELAARDVELEAFRHLGARVVGARQGADLGGVFHDEGGLPELVLHRFLEVEHLQARQRAGGEAVLLFGKTELAQRGDQPGGIVHALAGLGVAQDGLADGQALEGLRQVHRAALVGELQAARRLRGRIAHELLGEVHQVAVVPVGRVELHHRELWVVAHRDAFVAEVAVDLEHALEAADHQALEVELGRDAQVHLLLQRVVVRHERLGVGAAGNGVEHGRLHLQEAMLHHELADAAHGLAARDEALAGRLVGHQVHVALAVLHFLVGHAVELVGHRPQALGEQPQRGDLDRQLAGLGLHERAFGAHDVAQVPVLEGRIGFLTDRVAGHVYLDAAARGAERAVLHGGEAGLAHDALEHHAAGHAHGHGVGFERLGLGLRVLRLQIGRMVRGLEIIGEGHTLALGLGLPEGLELVAALGDELVVVGGGGGGRGRILGGEHRNERMRRGSGWWTG